MLSAKQVANYLCSYVESYRIEYARLTEHARGYPKIEISPYLEAVSVTAYVARDGVVVAVFEDLDGYTKPPAASLVTAISADLDPKGEMFLELMGVLPAAIDRATDRTRGRGSVTTINVLQYDLSLKDVVLRLTFGGLRDLVPKFLDSSAGFWDPFIVRNISFGTTDQPFRRLYHFLEILFHVHPSAWDSRSNWMRVHMDIARDYAKTLSEAQMARKSGQINLGSGGQPWSLADFDSVLSGYENALNEFAELLNARVSDERVFQDLFERHPILLDPGGAVVPKPRFQYPPGSPRPRDKTHLEPDFAVIYPFGRQYRLIELESPEKLVQTLKGHPGSPLTQAVHQTAEWTRFIHEHYEAIRETFPGINIGTNLSMTVIIGRSTGLGEMERMNWDEVRLTYPGVQILSFDELFVRARETYERVKGLGVGSVAKPPSAAPGAVC